MLVVVARVRARKAGDGEMEMLQYIAGGGVPAGIRIRFSLVLS